MSISRSTSLSLLALLLTAFEANATMRCGTSLISNGDSAQAVLQKCGAPDTQTSEGPARLANGVPYRNAAKVSHWVYGPRGGAYQHLRFIDDKLVSVETRRN
jgi:hypothetical protein